jgi:hypothetical protein
MEDVRMLLDRRQLVGKPREVGGKQRGGDFHGAQYGIRAGVGPMPGLAKSRRVGNFGRYALLE